MKASLEAFLRNIEDLSREELIQKLLQMKENEMDQSVILTEMRNTSTAMAREYGRTLESLKKLQAENARLKNDYRKVCEQNGQLLRKIFGRQSEKMEYMDEEPAAEDPLSEDAEEVPEEEPEGKPVRARPAKNTGLTDIKGKHKRKPRRGMDLDALPADHVFDVDAAKLDTMYGEGNWSIIAWHVQKKVERIPELDYVQYTHVPVVAVGPERKLIALPFEDVLRKRSIATSSLMASIMTDKFALAVTLYREEWKLKMRGFPLSRQNMANWILHFALNLFGPVYDRLWRKLKECPYIQNDETTVQVLRDGRKAGRKSYMWVHMTSELYDDCEPVVIFSYEMTRSADHLREYFGDYSGTMTSDAFTGYYSFAKEHKDTVILAGCLMHSRRPFALSAEAKDAAKLPEKEQKTMPEHRVLQILAEVFELEKAFRDLSADERKVLRNEKARPLLDEFFGIVRTLDPDDPEYSEQMKKGIRYALNHEAELRRFLDDGHIPCDNGACERHIRPFATGRKAWLFCNTIDGAKASAILFTLVETAKANNADPYYYLKYLLDSMPGHMDDHDFSFLDDMMPWSEAFRRYTEREKTELIRKYRLNASDEPPKLMQCRSAAGSSGIA